MKRSVITAMVFAASTALGAAAYAQDAHDTPKSGADTTQGHGANCCKPDSGDMTGMQGMAGHVHDHAQAPKKPAAKKSARKPGTDPTTK